jgi:hypothetical protein
MKIHTVEIQKLKAASHGNGLVVFKVDAMVTPKAQIDGIEPSSIITISEVNARVLMALLKDQLMELDGRKARSQR